MVRTVLVTGSVGGTACESHRMDRVTCIRGVGVKNASRIARSLMFSFGCSFRVGHAMPANASF